MLGVKSLKLATQRLQKLSTLTSSCCRFAHVQPLASLRNEQPQYREVDEIRSDFLQYFESHGHKVVKSASVVPTNDPSLLFTSAGMVPFKNMFLDTEPLTHGPRVTSSQNCIRAGGKHNDLDNVGVTARHHTFFEMLGNFSFGDYFKEEAMYFAWKFLTENLKLPTSRLRVTVFETDDESAKLWSKITGWKHGEADGRIVRMGEEDNFWRMGDTGPCGPCSEIYWDQIDAVDGDRFLEIWNLVFMQFETKHKGGPLEPLSRPCVDTGMGLERISAVMQGVPSNYEINTLKTLINRIDEQSQIASGGVAIESSLRSRSTALRVIADHMRSIIHLINDGVTPSNTGRGYVLRRILRRATRFASLLGAASEGKPFLHTLVRVAILEAGMLSQNPELLHRINSIARVVEVEELAFLSTISRGYRVLDEEAPKSLIIDPLSPSKLPVLPGQLAFTLYDRYGFPLDLTEICAKERGWGVDTAEFDRLIQNRKAESRKGWTGSGDSDSISAISHWCANNINPKFCGYEELYVGNAQPLAMSFADSSEQNAWVSIDPSPFYAQGGGQVGDKGRIRFKHESEVLSPWLEVNEVIKPYEGSNVLKIDVDKGSKDIVAKIIEEISAGGGSCITVEAAVDETHRSRVSGHHSATHLLHAALRKLLPTSGANTSPSADEDQPSTSQAGSFVGPNNLRFDFTYPRPLTNEELDSIQSWVNQNASQGVPVSCYTTTLDEATKMGAVALFGDKYQESSVRVVKFNPGSVTSDLKDNISIELCGGTHVKNSSECYPFVITKEVGVSSGVRRIEAVAGKAASELLLNRSLSLSRIAEIVRLDSTADARDVINGVTKLQKRVETLNSDLRDATSKLRQKMVQESTSNVNSQAESSPFLYPGWSCEYNVMPLDGSDKSLCAVVHGVPESDGNNYGLFRDTADTVAQKQLDPATPTIHVFIVETTGRIVVINSDWAVKKREKTGPGRLKDSEVETRCSAVDVWRQLEKLMPGCKGGGTHTVAQGTLQATERFAEIPNRVLKLLKNSM